MLGYTVRDPATGALGNLVSWTGLPPAREWQRETTVFERLVAAGTDRDEHRAGAVRGLRAHRGRPARSRPTRAAESLAARVDATVDALRTPGVAYLYWGDVDKAGHHHGWGSWQWGDALAELDAELGRLARLPAAGHGAGRHGRPRDGRRRPVRSAGTSRPTPSLGAGVALVAGEPRALHLHLEPGADPTHVVGPVAGRARVPPPSSRRATRRPPTGGSGEVAEHVLRRSSGTSSSR